MSKNSGFIIALPLVLIALIMQVYGLWGWLSRDGWIQYFLMAEVYVLIFITLLFLRSIIRLNNLWINAIGLLMLPLFFFAFRNVESAIGSMINSLWYINILISVIASTWMVVFVFGTFWSLKELSKQKMKKKSIIAFVLLISLSVLLTYIIKMAQLPDGLLNKIWEADKLRTIWFMLEPMIVLSFSLLSIYFYLVNKTKDELKREYGLMALLVVSIGFEYMINGVGLVSARTVIYFLGLFCFIKLIKNRDFVNYFLISTFIILLVLHLNYYSAAPEFYTLNVFIPFLHNALIESIKMFLAIYIFIIGWNSVKEEKIEFRLIMVLVSIVAYTYTTQSQGAGVHFYDIVAITAMLKLTALFLIVLYGFYYFRQNKPSEIGAI